MIRTIVRKGLRKVARIVEKNHLFEQTGERAPQSAIFEGEKSSIVSMMSNETLEEHVLQARLVNHWATWCAPCVEELPILRALQEQVGSEKLFGINWNLFQGDDPETAFLEVEQTVTEFGLKYHHGIVESSPAEFFTHFGLEEHVVPQTMVFSATYELLFHRVGVLTQEDIEPLSILLQSN